jgi:hypothetical protein
MEHGLKKPESVVLTPWRFFPSNTPSVLTIGRLIITARIAVIGRTLSQSGPAAEFKSSFSNQVTTTWATKVCFNTLAVGISAHRALGSLDLGFNQVGDDGIRS